ncbi:MAG: hypothetical protein AAGU11_04415 [Syntrophobacteraceae bacterium]
MTAMTTLHPRIRQWLNRPKPKVRVFKSLREVWETYLPNSDIGELEGRKKEPGILVIIPRPGK